MKQTNRRRCVLLILGLSGCASDYSVDATFPPPLVNTLPIDIALILSEEFQNYSFHEKVDDRKEINIKLGPAQSELFRVIAGQMFQDMTLVESFAEVDMVIRPEIDTFQYAIPRETRANIYEVWIKYRIQVTDASGQTLADWLINGYGKTPTAFLKSEGDALEAATTLALRDVGVQLSIGFARQQAIQNWLEDNAGEAI